MLVMLKSTYAFCIMRFDYFGVLDCKALSINMTVDRQDLVWSVWVLNLTVVISVSIHSLAILIGQIVRAVDLLHGRYMLCNLRIQPSLACSKYVRDSQDDWHGMCQGVTCLNFIICHKVVISSLDQ